MNEENISFSIPANNAIKLQRKCYLRTIIFLLLLIIFACSCETSKTQLDHSQELTLWHVIGTGQSNSIGNCSTCSSPLSTTQPYNNLKVETSVGNSGTTSLHVVPLVERVKPTDRNNSVNSETPYSGLANTVTKLARSEGLSDYKIVVSNNGEGCAPLKSICKNGVPIHSTGRFSKIDAASYANSFLTIDAAQAYASRNSLDYKVGAVVLIHGETDAGTIPELMPNGTNQFYKDQLEIFRKDYDKDVKAKTNQLNDVKLLITQQSFRGDPSSNMAIKNAQLEAALEYYNIILATPSYFLSKSDGVHFTNISARLLGEYIGKVYYKVVLKGENWRPLYPIEVVLNYKDIIITFNVPVQPLVFDGRGVPNRGFYWNDTGGRHIVNVTITGTNKITVSLNDTPSGVKKIGYAYDTDGELTDSDTTLGQSGSKLKNYCVAFMKAVD